MKYFLLLIVALFMSMNCFSQVISEKSLLSGIFHQVQRIPNQHFKDFFEVRIKQKADHFSEDTLTFFQTVFLGINDPASQLVIETEGYTATYGRKPDYRNEVAELVKGNLCLIEQRYTGSSLLNDSLFKYLSMRQIAEDINVINNELMKTFKGARIFTGKSKGGQSSLAFLLYKNDTSSKAIMFGTPFRNEQDDGRIVQFISEKYRTECGDKISKIQYALFTKKKELVTILEDYMNRKHLKFSFGADVLADHMILELPFSFWQGCHSCRLIPDPLENVNGLFDFLVSVVPPSVYSSATLTRSSHAYFLGASELGYYHYVKGPFSRFLTNRDVSMFDLSPQKIEFSSIFLNGVGELIHKRKDQLMFIYGENDPYSALSPDIEQVIKIPGKCHRISIDDLSDRQRKELRQFLLN